MCIVGPATFVKDNKLESTSEVATDAEHLLRCTNRSPIMQLSGKGEYPMLRKTLIGFAAAVLLGAAFVPDDALARGRGGGFHGGGVHAAGFRGHAVGVGGRGVAYRGGAYRGAAYRGAAYRGAAYRGAAWRGGYYPYRGAAVGAAAVGAAAVGAAAYGAYGYNNGCYRSAYGAWVCPQY
jgi:hypothetical protein